MSELAEYLSKAGHRVTVVTGFPNYPRGKIYDGYKISLYKKEIIKGSNIIRTPLYFSSKRKNFIHRMINHTSFMLTCIYGGLLSEKPDLIYYYSPPLFLGISSWILSEFFKVPIVADVNDLWPEAPIALGIIKNKAIKKTAIKFEKFVYRKTNHLFLYSNIMKEKLIKKGVPENKIEIHPLWVATDEFSSFSENEVLKLKAEFGFNSKFNVMYAGYFGLAQGLDVIINAADRLKNYDDISFVLLGDGPEKRALIKKAENFKLNNIKFVAFQPKEKTPFFLSAADVLFAHLDPAPHRLGTIPAKVLSYMSAGKPLIVAAKGETENLIRRIECGITVEPRNSQAIAEAVLEFYGNKELRKKMGSKGRDYAVQYFEKEKVLCKLEYRLVEIAKK